MYLQHWKRGTSHQITVNLPEVFPADVQKCGVDNSDCFYNDQDLSCVCENNGGNPVDCHPSCTKESGTNEEQEEVVEADVAGGAQIQSSQLSKLCSQGHTNAVIVPKADWWTDLLRCEPCWRRMAETSIAVHSFIRLNADF